MQHLTHHVSVIRLTNRRWSIRVQVQVGGLEEHADWNVS